MINVTVAGRLGKNAETRQAGNSSVTGFSVAGDTGFGDRKQSHWFNCSLWGKRGEAMQQYLTKGQEVVVIGEYSEREYNGNKYKELNVLDVKLMGGSQSQGQQQNNQQQNNQRQNNQQQNNQQQNNQQQGNQQQRQAPQQFNNQMNQAPQTMADAAVDQNIPF